MKFTTLMASAALALGLAGGAYAQDKTKVGFVFVGPVGDGGWTYEHNQGRLAVEKEFGDAVETVFVENVAEGPDSERDDDNPPRNRKTNQRIGESLPSI